MALNRTVQAALKLPRTAKRIMAISVDASICVISVWLAFYLRLGEMSAFAGNQWLSVIAALVIALPLFWVAGLYRAIFRYLGWSATLEVARACAIYAMLYASIFTFLGVANVPRTVGLIQPILLFLMVSASRAFVRQLLSPRLPAFSAQKVLIYGAGASGRQLASAIAGEREMRVVAFIDDDPTLHGSILNGKRIYSADDISDLVERKGVTDILLAIPSVTRQRRNQILDALRSLSVNVRTLPGLMDLAHGRIEVSTLRELEIEDLLGRDVAAPNQILFAKNILGKTVVVTGAGGSIGSELCRQIVAAQPRRLILIDNAEYSLYAIHHELSARAAREQSEVDLLPYLASVRDEARMREILAQWRPDTVYHAAAYKHVPMVEANPIEGVRNNVLGTWITARIAEECGVSDFVLISTDKAVRPTNVMGTSKRIAELVLQAMADAGSRTHFIMVRFGNVLDSSGSVVPLFRTQLRNGGPITVTHPEVTRYFMTIPEAAQLVIQAGAMGSGGEVFILDMGEPVKIVDLARKMIALSRMSERTEEDPNGEIEIKFIGLRQGEKLYEELLIDDNALPTAHPLIRKAREYHIPMAELDCRLRALIGLMDRSDVAALRSALQEIVPEFTPENMATPAQVLPIRPLSAKKGGR
jgi:FlaA1/EpsC-like NDP-sugar epimerase